MSHSTEQKDGGFIPDSSKLECSNVFEGEKKNYRDLYKVQRDFIASGGHFRTLCDDPKCQEVSLTPAVKLALLFNCTRYHMSGCDYLITES